VYEDVPLVFRKAFGEDHPKLSELDHYRAYFVAKLGAKIWYESEDEVGWTDEHSHGTVPDPTHRKESAEWVEDVLRAMLDWYDPVTNKSAVALHFGIGDSGFYHCTITEVATGRIVGNAGSDALWWALQTAVLQTAERVRAVHYNINRDRDAE